MDNIHTRTESRKVSDFDRVSIRGNICSLQLFITQGAQEGLTVEAPPDYLHRLRCEVKNGKLTVRLGGSWLQELQDALTTCLDSPHILYRLDVRQLSYLEVECASLVNAPRIETHHLKVKLSGTGDFKLDDLQAEGLEVYHSGTGIMRIGGQVAQQTVDLNGLGSYIASGLDSQRAIVHITGAGLARMRVSKTLDVNVRGMGTLEYIGNPSLSKQVFGSGSVVHLTEVREAAA